MKYVIAHDIRELAEDVVKTLGWEHIDLGRVIFLRSYGSSSKRVVARCHGLGRIWQKALGLKPHYIIEVISENFDNLNPEEKVKTVIHELMHIPKCFGGGFRHHDWVNPRNVKRYTDLYLSRVKETENHGSSRKILGKSLRSLPPSPSR